MPKYVAFTQHMGDVTDLDIPAGQIVAQRRLFPPSRSRPCFPRFSRIFILVGKAQCMEAIYPDVRADSARPGPREPKRSVA